MGLIYENLFFSIIVVLNLPKIECTTQIDTITFLLYRTAHLAIRLNIRTLENQEFKLVDGRFI